MTEEVPATEVVTPEALVVTTGVITEGARWETPLTELAVPPVLVTAVVPAVATGIVLASAPVVAPTPTMSAPSDQFDTSSNKNKREREDRKPDSEGGLVAVAPEETEQ